MFARETILSRLARRRPGIPAALAAVAAFALALATPITIDGNSATVATKTAIAKNGGGKGGGGSPGNSGNGGPPAHSNAGGKNKNTTGPTGANPEADRALLLVVPDPAIPVAQFTTRISKRYPADEITRLDDSRQAVSFFSEIIGMSGQTITHQWIHDGAVHFEASFKIRADHWRVWSTQTLPADMPGRWTVEIVNEAGEVLESGTLDFAPKAPVLAVH